MNTLETLDTIIEGCVQRKPLYQRQLYELYAKRMVAICMRYCGDYDVACDLMHDGFILVYNKVSSFENKGHFEGWLRKVFVNLCLEHLRKQDSLKDHADIDAMYDIDNGEADALQQMSAQEIMGYINQLPIGFKTVFNLYVIEGYSHSEIAEMLAINEASSRSQLSRARTILQKMILEAR